MIEAHFIPSVVCMCRGGLLGLIDLFVKAVWCWCGAVRLYPTANVCQAKPLKLPLYKPDFCLSIPISRGEQRCNALAALAWDKWYQSQPELKGNYRWVTIHITNPRVKEVYMWISQSRNGACKCDRVTQLDPSSTDSFLFIITTFYSLYRLVLFITTQTWHKSEVTNIK